MAVLELLLVLAHPLRVITALLHDFRELGSFENSEGGLGIGGTYAWGDDKYAVHGQVGVNTSLIYFGNSFGLTGTVGLTVRF